MNPPQFTVPSLEAMTALLPSFEFISLIASDEQGAVFLANQRSLDRQVAIKVLAPHFSREPEFQSLFEHTARSMAKLNHPNLISVFDSGCVEQMLYYVMEFVPGKSLDHSTHGHQVDIKQAVNLIDGICAGLANAHDHQIVHGDLKPSNILLNQKAQPKIGNFGFSHPTDLAAVTKESSRFIAPEVLENPAAATSQSDIFAVGAILYELTTGQHHGPDAPPPSGLSDCGAKMDAVWRQATAPDPSQRMADVRTLQAAIKDALASSRTRQARVTPASQKLANQGKSPVPKTSTPAAKPAATPLAAQKVGFNWKLFRNLFIIGGLLFAINLAWKNLERTRAERDEKQREIIAQQAADKEKALAEARKAALERSKPNATANPKNTPPPARPAIVEVLETPEESLARLRDALASGQRAEMPVGSVQKGDSDYLLISKPMTWPEAAWFAEQHGGHLAIPNAKADLTWLVANLAADKDIWIGAARSGRNNWTLADGSLWQPNKIPTGMGEYLTADKHGLLRAEKAKVSLPFVIQWHRDGSNPGALAAVLAATRSSLTQPNPVFPPGTRAFGTRHYLFIFRPLKWRDAVDLAQNAGGNLIVPSAIAETVNIKSMTDDLPAENGIWMGGFLKGDHWLWITGEPWKTAKWAKDAITTSPGSSLIIRPGIGWDAQDQSALASGFIIEWSDDGKSATAPKMEAAAPVDESAALVEKAKKVLATYDAERTKNLAGNAHRFSADLDVYIRGCNSTDKLRFTPHVNRLKAALMSKRVPSSIPRSSGIELSQRMADLAQYHAKKQEQIDLKFRSDADNLRSAFVTKLQEAQAQAKQSGQSKLAESIGISLDLAGNLDGWVTFLGFEAQPKNPEP